MFGPSIALWHFENNNVTKKKVCSKTSLAAANPRSVAVKPTKKIQRLAETQHLVSSIVARCR
jgi:hypothetical protein